MNTVRKFHDENGYVGRDFGKRLDNFTRQLLVSQF